MKTEFLTAIAGFAKLNIVVIGDVMLDHYIVGNTERTSPEAPVPVVLVNEESFFAGGAANVARNVAAAGANVRCVAVAGNDSQGQRLRSELDKAGVDTSGLIARPDFSTIVKTRVVSQGQQIVRLDYERRWAGDPESINRVRAAADGAIASADAVILSDYGKGLLCADVTRHVIAACETKGIPVFVDPKGRDYSRYRGAFAITPNGREACEETNIETSTQDGLLKSARAIQAAVESGIVIITRGAEGLALLNEEGNLVEVPTAAREVFDVTGAGDTFVAWLTLGVAAGLGSEGAARLANMAAGVSVGRSGPAVISPFDMRQAMASGRLGKKLVQESEIANLGEQLRAEGKRIVLTNGCFDFLHAGHIAFLQEARGLGDVLILAMNTDESIRRIKGAPRPIIGQVQREELLASLDAVDFVTVFHADTPHAVIRALRPDVLVKGSNYTQAQVEGAEDVRNAGGEVVILPVVHDIHTSKLLEGMNPTD